MWVLCRCKAAVRSVYGSRARRGRNPGLWLGCLCGGGGRHSPGAARRRRDRAHPRWRPAHCLGWRGCSGADDRPSPPLFSRAISICPTINTIPTEITPVSLTVNHPIRDDIAQFLSNTPDFFQRHAELLAAVQFAGPRRHRAVSLQAPSRDAAKRLRCWSSASWK